MLVRAVVSLSQLVIVALVTTAAGHIFSVSIFGNASFISLTGQRFSSSDHLTVIVGSYKWLDWAFISLNSGLTVTETSFTCTATRFIFIKMKLDGLWRKARAGS